MYKQQLDWAIGRAIIGVLAFWVSFSSHAAIETRITNLVTLVRDNVSAADPHGLAVLPIDEKSINVDLNGDGDFLDWIAHVFDPDTEELINTGVDIDPNRINFPNVTIFENLVVLQAERTFNQTGFEHSIVYYYDHLTRTTRPAGPGSDWFLGARTTDGRLGLTFDELRAAQDLNGDGDINDSIPGFFNPTTGAVELLNISNGIVFPGQEFLIVAATEGGSVSGIDYNSDGDKNDTVAFVLNPQDNNLINTKMSISGDVIAGRNFIAHRFSERHQGNIDFNNDGDTNDNLIHVYDLPTRTSTILIRAQFQTWPSQLIHSDDLLVGTVPEFLLGEDLNSDGDLNDSMIHVYDHRSGEFRNLGLASHNNSSVIKIFGEKVFFSVPESSQSQDLNGNGMQNDHILHVYDANERILTNIGISNSGMFGSEGPVFVRVAEISEGIDLNGDGDTMDSVMHTLDPDTLQFFNIGVSGDPRHVRGNELLFTLHETGEGRDFNDDGDQTDLVLALYNAVTDEITNLEFATRQGGYLVGSKIVFTVDERQQGRQDINGDGDFLDELVAIGDPAIIILPSSVEDLIAEVHAALLDNGTENSLLAKLMAAQSAIERGQINAAINSIEAFENQIVALTGKKIDKDSVADWLLISTAVIQSLTD